MQEHEVAKLAKDKLGLSKETINILRTTMRNNIELTAIADNKANVLLSLNAVLIAFVVPLAISNLEVLVSYILYIPLVLLAITCFATIYLSTLVLSPFRFDTFNDDLPTGMDSSPFFFGTAYGMSLEEYYDKLINTSMDKESVRQFITQDLFFIGRRLGEKMALIRRSFQIFRIGMFVTLLATALVLLV
ncbi:MAG: Pycsar system effector family protein [Bacteroidota bacterium]